mmetsp:Transcript_32862/g.54276  ORF Transcript_32862/g.54276 Transcript_32862/m.54276 type:complete len:804 (+) Transcript_32862:89-2500(+)
MHRGGYNNFAQHVERHVFDLYHLSHKKRKRKALALNDDASTFLKHIFSRLDKDQDGYVTRQEFEDCLHFLGDSTTTNALVSLMPGCKNFSLDECAQVFFAQRKRSPSESVCFFLMMWVMPVAYSASTRLPFISLALEVTTARGGSLNQVGIILGVYQTCRSIANGLIGAFGGTQPFCRMYAPMVFLGLCGWLASFVFLDQGVWTPLSLSLVGLSEVVVCLQSGLIRETNMVAAAKTADAKHVTANLRLQYAAVSCGSCMAYIAGGALYTKFGFEAICLCGVGCQATQLIAFALYVMLSFVNARPLSERSDSPFHSIYEIVAYIGYQLEAIKIMDEERNLDGEHSQTSKAEDLASAKLLVAQKGDLVRAIGKLYDATFDKAGALPHEILMDIVVGASSTRSNVLTGPQSTAQDVSLFESSLIWSLPESSQLKREISLASKQIVATLDTNGDGKVMRGEFIHFVAPRVYAAIFGDSTPGVSVVWKYLRVVVVTQAVMALCIGSFLSTALLLYTHQFGVTASMVGLLLGIGEGLGALTIFITFMWPCIAASLGCAKETTKGKSGGVFATLLSRPLHVPMVLICVSLATMGFGMIPHFAIAIICQMIMSLMNDLSVSLLNELMATSMPPAQFEINHAFGQWLRRLGNMLTGLTGPILFGIYPGLPFVMYGGIVALWACFLWFEMHMQAVKIVPREDHFGSGPISAFMPFAGSKPFHQYEREYYFDNRNSLLRGEGKVLAYQFSDTESVLRRMRAELLVEKSKRKRLETEVAEVKRIVARMSNFIKCLDSPRIYRTFSHLADAAHEKY